MPWSALERRARRREHGPGGGALIGNKRCDRRLRAPGRRAGAQKGVGVVGVGVAWGFRVAANQCGPCEIGMGDMRAGRRHVLAIRRGAA
jgi:hypothetical protein